MAGSTSKQPLVAKRRRQQSSLSRFLAPVTSFSFSEWIDRRPPPEPRSIYINEPLPSEYFDKNRKPLKIHQYPTNQIVTSKYTIVTFLPQNLLEQFKRIANCFFLFIAILQFFPQFSTISPGLVLLPLLLVLAITALKDGYEDVKRHQADQKVNNSVVHVLRGPGYENTNPTKAKTRTFVPKISLPKRKSKKSKNGEMEQLAPSLEKAKADTPARTAEPSGQGNEVRRTVSMVSAWDEDPEAGDHPDELGWHRTIWEDVKVGDVVKIYDNEQLPAGESGPE